MIHSSNLYFILPLDEYVAILEQCTVLYDGARYLLRDTSDNDFRAGKKKKGSRT